MKVQGQVSHSVARRQSRSAPYLLFDSTPTKRDERYVICLICTAAECENILHYQINHWLRCIRSMRGYDPRCFGISQERAIGILCLVETVTVAKKGLVVLQGEGCALELIAVECAKHY